MESYDNWKQDLPEYPENKCDFCGEPCDNSFCNSQCRKEYEQDN